MSPPTGGGPHNYDELETRDGHNFRQEPQLGGTERVTNDLPLFLVKILW